MKQVLLAEDNPANRELLTEVLERWGFGVVSAANGREALACLDIQLPDLALVDIQMPESDGYQLIRRIRQDPRLRHLRVIALTAFAMRGDREAILARGFDAYLTKPVDFNELRNELETTNQTSGSSHEERKRQ